jgi:hypothetical protein
MAAPLDMTWHPWYDACNNETIPVNDIYFKRNNNELVWHQEYIYQCGELIGEIYTNIDGEGYNLRKYVEPTYQFVANFNSVTDAKDFVLQAGGL